MRVYLPATVPLLAEALDAGALRGAPLRAYAVTPEFRDLIGDDEEELEYAALNAAADASLALLAADSQAPQLRVVLSAEIREPLVLSGGAADPAAVTLGAPVPLRRLASAHIDAAEAAPDIARAAREDLPREADGHELLWYAVQELGYLVAEAWPGRETTR